MIIYIGGYPRKIVLDWDKEYKQLGSLYSPGQQVSNKIRFCLDNGAFKGFDEYKFLTHLEKGLSIGNPDFIVCPDVLLNPVETRDSWDKWQPILKQKGYPLAYVVQDNQRIQDIPSNCDLLFLGGSTEYKLRTMKYWCKRFPTHVGRVNTWNRLWLAQEFGAISCDGTGWFRKSHEHWSAQDLLLFLKIQKGVITPIYNYPYWPFVSLSIRKSLMDKFIFEHCSEQLTLTLH